MELHNFRINNAGQIDSPALIVFEEKVIQNIDKTLRLIGDLDRLRPHVKTHKSPDVTRLLMDRGITKFKCATIAEAEMLGSCGAEDVLLAYQPVGPKISRFLELTERFPDTKFSCLTDNLLSATRIAQKAIERDSIITVFIDIDTGMHRTGISPDQKALELINTIFKIPGIHFAGLHVYDGHISQRDIVERTKAVKESFAPVEKIKTTLEEKKIPVKIVAGGSPTFPIHALNPEVECSPGTFVFWDKGYLEKCPEQNLQPAAVVLSRIISKTGNRRYCLDLGYKSIAAENPLDHRVFFPDAPDIAFIGQSEEHLVVEVPAGTDWNIGDIVIAIPTHICPTVALYEEIKVVKDHTYYTSWPVKARNRKIII